VPLPDAVFLNPHVVRGSVDLEHITAWSPAEILVWETKAELASSAPRAICDAECAVGAAPRIEPQSPEEYHVQEAAVRFWGLCPDCRRAAAVP